MLWHLPALAGKSNFLAGAREGISPHLADPEGGVRANGQAAGCCSQACDKWTAGSRVCSATQDSGAPAGVKEARKER